MNLDDTITVETKDLEIGLDPYNPAQKTYDWQSRGDARAYVFFNSSEIRIIDASRVQLFEALRAIIEPPTYLIEPTRCRITWGGEKYAVKGVLVRHRRGIPHHFTLSLDGFA